MQQPFLLGDKVSFRGYKDVVVAKLGYLQARGAGARGGRGIGRARARSLTRSRSPPPPAPRFRPRPQTVLRLSDSSLLYVPNGAFIASEVQNHSRSQLTRVAGSFCLRFRDAPNLATLLPALDGALRELPQFDGPPGGGPVARCAGFDGPGPVVRVEARFRRGPLGGDEVTSAAWLAVGRVVRDQGCGFAEAAAAAHGGGGAHGAGAAPAR